MNWHQIEVYWGSEDGTLYHTTLEVFGDDLPVIEATMRKMRIRPSDTDDWSPACAQPRFGCGHYDLEVLV